MNSKINETEDLRAITNCYIEDLTFIELSKALKKCENNKVPGIDNISVELFKYSSLNFRQKLAVLFNKILYGEDPPEDWQKAVVIALFKKGVINNCHNGKCVSLLNSGYKIYSKFWRLN
jgi:hypothetical protein